MTDKKDQLVAFLESRVFDPIMRAKPEDYSQPDQKRLSDVQEATRAEIDRFRDYGSAEEVVTNFKRDLNSEPAKKIHAESRALKLPTLNEVQEAFEMKAHDLGVSG